MYRKNKKYIVFVCIISLSMIPSAISADDMNFWQVTIFPPIAFIDQNISINISSATPSTAFVFQVKKLINSSLVIIFTKQFITNPDGNFSFEYTPSENGTFFIFIGDGENLFIESPLTIIVLEEQGQDNENETRDDYQDKLINGILLENAHQGQLISKILEWIWILLVVCISLIMIILEIGTFFFHHLIHEHKTYWNRQKPSTTIEYAQRKMKKYKKEGGWFANTITKYLTLSFVSQPGEIDGFQHRPMNPTFFEELQTYDIDDIIRGIELKKPKRLRFKRKIKQIPGYPKIDFHCPICGHIYDAVGPRTICQGCGAMTDAEYNKNDGGEVNE